jgi:hypothetical protein
MMTGKSRGVVSLSIGFAAVLCACGDGDDVSEDVAYAQDLWLDIADHDSWALMPGTVEFEPSSAPHGPIVRVLLDEIAAADPTALPDGSVIIKRNYQSDTEGDYNSLTVMKRRAGYSPDAGDWFWVKYDPEGNIMSSPDGTPLAGRIGLGGTTGCIPCHDGAPGGDLVFRN